MTQTLLFPEVEPLAPQRRRRKKISEILGCASTANTPVPNEFLPTPWECSVALLRAEGKRMPARVWEPCCGAGDISKELERAGREVVSTDLIDRGYGRGGVDFFAVTEPPAKAMVTNPPWSLAEK